jgi:hypothetical protein
MSLPSAYMVALLTALNIKRYADEKSKKISRFRMSRQTLGKIAKRQLLRQSFLGEFEEHLSALGWLMFAMPDGGYAFLEIESVEGWTKISSSRIASEITAAAKGRIADEDIEGLLELSDDAEDMEADS